MRCQGADRLRGIGLARVATACGYRQDPKDRSRWKRPGSVLSINGERFFDHVRGTGGGGAIDLVMHSEGCTFLPALEQLERMVPGAGGLPSGDNQLSSDNRDNRDDSRASTGMEEATGPARLPGSVYRNWDRVSTYLVSERGLDPGLLARCHHRRMIWADRRGNAVFMTRDAKGEPAGAELHGTCPDHPFRGMCRGSRKALGGFWLARRGNGPALLAESAIDALSVFSLPELAHIGLVVSSAGTTSRLPPWIGGLGVDDIRCGFDADAAGDEAAANLIGFHPQIRRLRPTGGKDWNEQLQQLRNRSCRTIPCHF